MASAVDLAWQNFEYRIATISATETTILSQGFSYIDRLRLQPETARSRTFSVRWLGSAGAPPDSVQDIYQREAEHLFETETYYNVGVDGLQDKQAQIVMAQDRHDQIKQLRDTANFNGISAASPSTSTGIVSRVRVEDELDTESDLIWVLRIRWMVCLLETE